MHTLHEEINTVSIVNYKGTKIAIYCGIIIQYARALSEAVPWPKIGRDLLAALCSFFFFAPHQPSRQLLARRSISTLNLYTIRPQ